MNPFWTDVTEPLARALAPKVIVEIGSDEGVGTEKLLHFCKESGAVLHVIDPLPSYDVAAWRKQWGDTLAYHLTTSLAALPTIAGMEMVFVDGDHNWHTVRNELEAIHGATVGAGGAFPLTLFHDVEWPYGRRDLYYDPSTVPEAHRHPYASAGMAPGQSELIRGGGYNAHRFNAVHEGGAHNGVRTAIEDFVNDHADEDYVLITLPLIFGLGILYRRNDPRPEALQHLLDTLQLDARTESLLALAERERVAALIDADEKGVLIDEQRKRIEAVERALVGDQSAMADMRNRELRARSQLAVMTEQRNAREAELAITRNQLDSTESELATTKAQLTALQDRWSAWEMSRTGRALAYLRWRAQRHPRLFRAFRRAVLLAVAARRKLRNPDFAARRGPIGDMARLFDRSQFAQQRHVVAQSGLFDATWYTQTYPDVGRSGLDPLTHYLRHGGFEGRDPNPAFQSDHYLRHNPDVRNEGINPLYHYVRFGEREGRPPSPDFDPTAYCEQAPEARDAPLAHYLKTRPPETPAVKKFEPDCPPWSVFEAAARAKPTHAANAQLDVIIPVYRDRSGTLACIASVLQSRCETPFELIVVDDKSPEPALSEDLRRLAGLGLITLLANATNLGFVGAVNRGMRLHPDRDVLLLNSDTLVFNDWLDRIRAQGGIL